MKPQVEFKVRAATVAAYVGLSAVLYVLELIAADPILVTPLPDVLEPLAVSFIPGVAAFVAGYRARHTPRPDLTPTARRM